MALTLVEGSVYPKLCRIRLLESDVLEVKSAYNIDEISVCTIPISGNSSPNLGKYPCNAVLHHCVFFNGPM